MALTSLKVTGGTFVGGAAFTAYHYPELRREPRQLLSAMFRGVRCIHTGLGMALDYLNAGDNITSETHYHAAGRMYNMFVANQGTYIKLG